MGDVYEEHMKRRARIIDPLAWKDDPNLFNTAKMSARREESLGRAVLMARMETSAGLALVPVKATEAMVDVACDVHDCPEKFRQEVINAAIREGDILKPGDGK